MSPLNSSPEKLEQDLWRDLSELEKKLNAGDADIFREFPQGASVWQDLDNPTSRRNFLKLMGASIALAGITACTKMPVEKIIPYVIEPEDFIPGKPRFFATASSFGGYAKGILVESHEGRPTKIEGNPRHPAILGKSDIFTQAELLQLYDPDRAKAVFHAGEISTWDEFIKTILNESRRWKKNHGAGVRILTHPVTSPTLLNELSLLQRLYPKSKWHSYEPIHNDFTRKASQLVFNKEVKPLFDFKKAKIVLSLDSDFLGPGPLREKYARDFMSLRKLGRGATLDQFNQLYVIESSPSLTGATADHRWPIQPSGLLQIVRQLAKSLNILGTEITMSLTPIPEWLVEVTTLLRQNAGHCIVIAGEQQPVEVQALAFAINAQLGNIEKTVSFIPFDDPSVQIKPLGLEDLIQDIQQGQVSSIFVLGANPVYDTPATLNFSKNFNKIPLRIKIGMYSDETAYHSHWLLPESHFLESWGDLRAYDGTVSIQQPLIFPLYQTRSFIELLSILTERPGRTSSQAVRDFWKAHLPRSTQDFDQRFEHILSEGFIQNTAFSAISPKSVGSWKTLVLQITEEAKENQKQITSVLETIGSDPKAVGSHPDAVGSHLEVVFRPDPTVWDGKYSNNGWLQELPKPLLQLTWDNVILLSPVTAKRYALEDEERIELELHGRKEQGIILRAPGHPDNTLTLYFGYGRTRAGNVGNRLGYNAYLLQNHLTPYHATQARLKKLGVKGELSTVHSHSQMEGREIIVHSKVQDFKNNPNKIIDEKLKTKQPSLFSIRATRAIPGIRETRATREIQAEEVRQANLAESKPPAESESPPSPEKESVIEAWAMVIDLTSCIGCKACTIACQAENNIPIVGKDEVRKSREMHWIRVDRYFHGDPSNPQTFFQPVPCMHCEKAPCEVVCPTAATHHSSDGLNQMIYNRCVGTRYCSNNCPYKVRRFNFFQYSDTKTPSIQLMQNPDVTIRSRGVMEKCTYCIQRIQSVRIEAQKEDRAIQDLVILTACQQACPTDAIIFGNQNDPTSLVSLLKKLPQHYKLLNELGTEPRTTYLALIKNPNPKLKQENSR